MKKRSKFEDTQHYFAESVKDYEAGRFAHSLDLISDALQKENAVYGKQFQLGIVAMARAIKESLE